MTEKRFIPIFDGTDKRVVGAKDNGKIISFMDMFDLLNDLSEENEQLKSYNGEMEDYLARLEEMNEQLKKENKKLQGEYDKQLWLYNGLGCEYDSLKEENEQLKKDRFICLDCEHSGYAEIGCLCEYTDHWQEYITECEEFKELRE